MSLDSETKQKLFDRELRLIERGGYYLTIVYVAFLFVCGAVWGTPYNRSWSLVLIHLIFGRPGNVAAGVYEGYHWIFVFIQCNLQDIIFLYLVYPLVVAGSRKLVHNQYLKDRVAILHGAANRHKKLLEPFGAVGLIAFVYLPVATTGLLVGALIGHLLGMRTRVVFASVIIGNLLIVGSLLWAGDFVRTFYVEHASHIKTIEAWSDYLTANKGAVGIGILSVIGVIYLVFKGIMWWWNRGVRKPALAPGGNGPAE